VAMRNRLPCMVVSLPAATGGPPRHPSIQQDAANVIGRRSDGRGVPTLSSMGLKLPGAIAAAVTPCWVSWRQLLRDRQGLLAAKAQVTRDGHRHDEDSGAGIHLRDRPTDRPVTAKHLPSSCQNGRFKSQRNSSTSAVSV